MFPELSNHVMAAMFLASLLFLAQGLHAEDSQLREVVRVNSSQRKFPKGIGMAILDEIQWNRLLPRLIERVNRERMAKAGEGVEEEAERMPSYLPDRAVTGSSPKRHLISARTMPKVGSRHRYLVKRVPFDVSRRIATDTLRQRRKKAKMLINNLAALFTDLKNGESRGPLLMPSLRIG